MFDAVTNLPRSGRCKPLVALAAAASALAGCGGGDPAQEARLVRGPGFTFSAPAEWDVTVRRRAASATPGNGAGDLVSVTVFRLARPYRPELWETVEPELDRVATTLAEELGGRIDARATVVVAGRRAKRYDIRYVRGGSEVVERTAFVLQGRRELQLVCRYGADGESEARRACDLLFSTLRLR